MVLTRVGDAYRYLNDYENSQIYYKKALDVDFDMFAILGLALLQKEQGRYEEALIAIKSLIKIILKIQHYMSVLLNVMKHWVRSKVLLIFYQVFYILA